MFSHSVVASLVAILMDVAAASWQWEGRTLDDRRAVLECVKSGQAFSFTTTIGEFPSAKVSKAESDVTVATLIDIKYSANFKVITNSKAKEQYVLTQCGTEAPTDAVVDAVKKLDANYKRKHFTVPLEKAIATQTTMLGFVAALGLEDRMMAVSARAVAPCWQKASTTCSATLADQWSNKTLMKIQHAAADGVFDDCNGGCSMSNGIAFNPTADPGNLHGAEYIKVMAAFFNKEAEANKIFDAKMTTYAAMSSASMATKSVAWINYQAAATYNLGEGFYLSMADYKKQMVKDAGYKNVDPQALKTALPNLTRNTDGTTWVLRVNDYASKNEAATAFFGALSAVSAVIDEVYAPKPKDYDINTFYAKYNFTNSSQHAFMKHVLRIDGTMSVVNDLDWYESRIANPEWALEGLRHAVSGDASMRRKYFRNIAKDEVPKVLSADMCSKKMPTCEAKYPEVILCETAKAASTTKVTGAPKATDTTKAPEVSAAMGAQAAYFPLAILLMGISR